MACPLGGRKGALEVPGRPPHPSLLFQMGKWPVQLAQPAQDTLPPPALRRNLHWEPKLHLQILVRHLGLTQAVTAPHCWVITLVKNSSLLSFV